MQLHTMKSKSLDDEQTIADLKNYIGSLHQNNNSITKTILTQTEIQDSIE